MEFLQRPPAIAIAEIFHAGSIKGATEENHATTFCFQFNPLHIAPTADGESYLWLKLRKVLSYQESRFHFSHPGPEISVVMRIFEQAHIWGVVDHKNFPDLKSLNHELPKTNNGRGSVRRNARSGSRS